MSDKLCPLPNPEYPTSLVPCGKDCAWRIGDDCAMVVLAKAARVNACANCGITSKSQCEGCTNLDGRTAR